MFNVHSQAVPADVAAALQQYMSIQQAVLVVVSVHALLAHGEQEEHRIR